MKVKLRVKQVKEMKAKVECINVRGELLIQTPPDKR